MNIVRYFTESAGKFPENIALICGDQSMDYASLDEAVKQTAGWLEAQGINKGDRVLVFVPMSLDLYRIVLALFYLGSVAVFLDEWVGWKRLKQCGRMAECKAMIGIPKARLLAFFSSEMRRIPIKLGLGRKYEKYPAAKLCETTTDDPALITFTTGSTGNPKAAWRTHGFLNEQFKALIKLIEPEPGEVDMPTLPIVLLCNLGVGATSVIADFKPSKPDQLQPERILKQIHQHGVERLTTSPFFMHALADYGLEKGKKIDGIKKIFTGGAPVFPEEVKKGAAVFSKAAIQVVYGSTEAEPISTVEGDQLSARKPFEEKGLLVGATDPIIKIKIIAISDEPIGPFNSQEWQSKALADGAIGEIVVAGPHVLKEYLNSPEAMRQNKVDVDGEIWHRTGDAGFLKSGDLFLTGRCNRMIKHQDEWGSPFLWEGHLKQLSNLSGGTVLKVREQLCLVLEGSNLDPDLENQLREKLPGLNRIFLKQRLPRDPRHHSKFDYQKIESWVSQKLT